MKKNDILTFATECELEVSLLSEVNQVQKRLIIHVLPHMEATKKIS